MIDNTISMHFRRLSRVAIPVDNANALIPLLLSLKLLL